MRWHSYDKGTILYDFTIQAKRFDMFLTDICEVFLFFRFSISAPLLPLNNA